MTTTVFISYSRKDADFVRRLYEALAAQDRQIWVDWEGIPPSVEWMKQIVEAIDASGAFIFVLTPHSVASPICRQELEHAVAQNKRLIPIVRHEVEPALVPEMLAKMNWIFFRDHDDFSGALTTLVTAVDTDFDWVHAHTRLLVRAREWDAKRREDSLALRGNDLKAAEHWLTLGPTKQPQPTELQTLYILGSRKVATKRRYVLLCSAMIGLVAVAILGTTTYFGRRNAARQQTMAVAGRLTGDAELLRSEAAEPPGDSQLAEHSVLLAAEAAGRLASIGTRSLQTDIALRRSLALLPNRVHRFEHDERVYFEDVVLTDERIVGVSLDPLGVGHWLLDGAEIAKKQADGSAKSATISPDGMFIASVDFGNVSGAVDIWDTTKFERVAGVHGIVGSIGSTALGPGAMYLVANASDWNATTNGWMPQPTHAWFRVGNELHELGTLPSAHGLVFSPDGAWLAGVVNEKVKVWAVAAESHPGLEEIRLPAPMGTKSVLFSADGKQLLLTHDDTVETLTVGDWKPGREFNHDGGVWALAPQGKFVAVTGEEADSVRILDISARREATREVVQFHVNQQIQGIAFSPSSQTVAILGHGNAIDLFRIAPGGSDIARIGVGTNVYDMVFDAGETALITVGRSQGGIAVRRWAWDEARDTPTDAVELPGDLATLSTDGRFVAVASAQKLIVATVRGGRTVRGLSFPGNATAVALSPEGAFVAVATDDKSISLWPIQDESTPQRFAVPTNIAAREFALGISGSPLFAVTSNAMTRAGQRFLAHTWQPPKSNETRRPLTGKDRSGFFVSPSALSPDARYFASDQSGVIVVQDTQTDRIVARLGGGGGTCVFSPDSTRLATAGRGVVRVWDIPTQTEIARIETDTEVSVLRFSPRNRYLATAVEGVARIWLLEPADLVALTCARATRNLSLEERRNYFGDAPDRPICPALPVPESAPRE